MNTTGCPPNTAADYLFGFPTSYDTLQPPPCDINITAVIVIYVILICLKALTVAYLVTKNMQRNAYLRKLGRTSEMRRIPLTAVTSLATLACICGTFGGMFVPSLWMNSFCMTWFGVATFVFGINLTLHLRKIERLGVQLHGTNTTISNTKNRTQQFITILQVPVFAAMLVASLAAPGFPGNRIPSQIALSCTAIFQFLHTIRFVTHNTRVMSELAKLQTEQNQFVVKRQSQRFRTELQYGVFGEVMGVTLDAAIAAWPSIWLVTLATFLEILFAMILLILAALQSRKHRKQVAAVAMRATTGSFIDLISQSHPGHHRQQSATSHTEHRFVLHRQGSQVAEEVDLNVILEQAIDADVVEDDLDQDVSILTNHTVFLNNENTVFAHVFGFVPTRVFNVLSKAKSPRTQGIFVVTNTLIGCAIISLVTTGILAPVWGFLQFIVFWITIGIMSATIDISVAKRVIGTSWFQVRLATNMLAIGLLGDVFGGDMRLALLPALLTGPFYTYISDALVPAVESSKISIAIAHLLASAMIALLLQFDVVANANNRILHFNDYATYSVYQLCRDLFTSCTFFCAFNVYECWERGMSSRLSHVGVKVNKLVKRYDPNVTSVDAVAPKRFGGGQGILHAVIASASHVEMRHGYFVHDEQQQSATDIDSGAIPLRHIVLDAIVLKEVDSLSVNYLGIERGVWFFRFAQYNVGAIIIWAPFYCLVAISIVVSDAGPPEVCYGLIVLTILYVVRQLATLSRTVVLLLQRRLEFWVGLFFSTTWVILMTIVMPRDARLCVVWFCYAQVVLESTQDAHLTSGSSLTTLMFKTVEKIQMGCVFLLLAVFSFLRSPALLEKTLDSEFTTMNFRPDIVSRPGVAYSDLPAVLDVTQMAADLTLGLALKYFTEVILWLMPGNRGKFTHIKAPVRKKIAASSLSVTG